FPAAHRLLLPERFIDLGAGDIAQADGDLAEETAPGRIGRNGFESGFLDPEDLGKLVLGQMLRLDQKPADGSLDRSLRLPFEAFLELILLEDAFLDGDLTEKMRILSNVHP